MAVIESGLILSATDVLLVSSRDTNSVLAYDGETGVPQGVFVAEGSGGLSARSVSPTDPTATYT